MTKNNDRFSTFLAASILLHLLLFLVYVIGLPHFFSPLPEEEFTSVEMLPLAEITNIKTEEKHLEEAVKNEEAKKTEKINKAEPTETKPIEEEKPKEPIKEPEEKPKPKEEAVPVKENKPEPKKAEEPKKEDDAKPKKAPEKKPAEKPKKPKPKVDVDAMLKNLEESSDGTNEKSRKTSRAEKNDVIHDAKGAFDPEKKLSENEISLIKRQIEQNWNVAGAQALEPEQVQIFLYISFAQDGTVENVTIKEKRCARISESMCEAIAQNAVRAVKKASPFKNLNQFRYNIWKEFNIGFDPAKAGR